MRALVIAGLLVAGLLVGVVLGRASAEAADSGMPAHEVVAVLRDTDFASTDSDAVQIVRTQIEGHDVWVAVGYQKFGITHHPECRLCAARASEAPAN